MLSYGMLCNVMLCHVIARPRASAVAERLWSDRHEQPQSEFVSSRLQEQICRMRRYGSEILVAYHYDKNSYLQVLYTCNSIPSSLLVTLYFVCDYRRGIPVPPVTGVHTCGELHVADRPLR
jgi:hypothetical protein